MRMHDAMSSPLEIAPVIFPKPPAKDPEDGAVRSFHVLESLRRHRMVSGLTPVVLPALQWVPALQAT